MADEGFKRKLTAILSADVVGYSRIGGSAMVTVKGTKGNDPVARDGIGILIDDASTVNSWGGGELIVENKQMDGIWSLRGSNFETGSNSSAQIRNNGGHGIQVMQRFNGRLRSGIVIQDNI